VARISGKDWVRIFGTRNYYAKLPALNVLPSRLINEGVAPVVILGRDVPARERPDPTSRVIAKLSYDVVRHSGPIDLEIVGIELSGGRQAYVERRYAGVVEDDFHACFAHLDGNWRLTVLARGPAFYGDVQK